MLVISSLNVSTKYHVRVLASTKVGRGEYSESKGKFTNGSKCRLSFGESKLSLSILLLLEFLFSSFYYLCGELVPN